MERDERDDGLRFTRAELCEIDRLASAEYGIPSIVLMEHAGRSAAELILHACIGSRDPRSARTLVLCGGGNNGGDGFVIARWLADLGVPVECACTTRMSEMRGDALVARTACARAGIVQHEIALEPEFAAARAHCIDASKPRIVVDALLGTGFEGSLRPAVARAIALANELRAEPDVLTVAIDVPSGLDCDRGTCTDPCVHADLTGTFVGRKIGFDTQEARAVLGRVHVLSIGAPRAAIERARGLTTR